ncbi:MAG: acyl-CoA dehydrogenase [bacterium]
MGHYKANVRDVEFALFEVLKADELLGKPPFEHVSRDDVQLVIREAARFAQEVFGELYQQGDEAGCRLVDGKVRAPEVFRAARAAFMENGWQQLSVDVEDGGQGLPYCFAIAAQEFFTSANPALTLYCVPEMFANIIRVFGTPEQVARFCPGMFEGRWSGTMVLTEPEAGSDVGAARTRAKRLEGTPYYHIDGAKRFITSGDFDLVENIIHLVLARVEGAPAGTKGLSLFIVPKIWVHEDGTLGEPNDVACTGIEHKMGLHGSATCQLNFGENGRCRGVLLGNQENRGMSQMFELMNEARLWTGLKAQGLASTAYLNALAYARDRVQGADHKSLAPDAPRVAILRHPDVRRMLLDQKSKVEAMRALILRAAWLIDRVRVTGGRQANPADQAELEILTPLIKAYCSEESFFLISEAMQVMGGSGYCRDYPIEQYLRDVRVTAIYEGTTHIQALDLVTRKIPRAGGEEFRRFLERIRAVAREREKDGFLAAEGRLLDAAAESLTRQVQRLISFFGEDVYLVGLNANALLWSVAEVALGRVILEQAVAARNGLKRISSSHPDHAFYRGKIEAARFFMASNLPNVHRREEVLQLKDTSCLEIPDEAF